MTPETKSVRVRDDGTDPTSTVKVGSVLKLKKVA